MIECTSPSYICIAWFDNLLPFLHSSPHFHEGWWCQVKSWFIMHEGWDWLRRWACSLVLASWGTHACTARQFLVIWLYDCVANNVANATLYNNHASSGLCHETWGRAHQATIHQLTSHCHVFLLPWTPHHHPPFSPQLLLSITPSPYRHVYLFMALTWYILRLTP